MKNNSGATIEPVFGILAVIGVIVTFTALTGGYDNMNWDELVPLFKILIPYLFVVGFPLLIVLVAVVIVKSGKVGGGLIADFFRRPEPVKTKKRGRR